MDADTIPLGTGRPHLMLKTVASPAVGAWLIREFGQSFDVSTVAELGAYAAIGVVQDGVAVAGLAVTEYRKLKHGSCARVTFAAKGTGRWATRGIMRQLCEFVFVECGVTTLLSVVSEKNRAALKLNRQMGFRRIGVVPRGYDGKTNAIVFSMLPEPVDEETRHRA